MASSPQIISMKMQLEGDHAIKTRVRNVRNEFGQLGTQTVVTSKSGQTLSETWRANTKQAGILGGSLRGLALRFVGLQAIVGFGTRALHEMWETLNKGIQSFRKFEKSMAEVSTLLDDVGMKSMPAFTSSVESMSIRFGKSADDMAQGLYQIISAAVPVSDALNLLNIASKAAIAGLSDVKTSVDVLTSVLNSYHYSVEQMIHISDIMFESVRWGKFKFDDLANALGYVVPIAAQAGISFEELSAAFTTTTRHGLHLDMTARGLALAITGIIKPSKQAADYAASLGLDLSLTALKTKGLIGFMQDLAEVTGGNASKIAQIVPNMRSYRVVMILAGKGIKDFSGDIEKMTDSLGATDRAFDKMADTAAMTADILTQSFEQSQRDLGSTTQELDFMMKKFDIFKSQVVAKGFEDPLGLTLKLALNPVYAFADLFGGAAEKSNKYSDQAEKLAEFYGEQVKRSVEGLDEDTFSPKKTLFERMMEGEEVDLSNANASRQKWANLVEKYTEKAGQFQQKSAMGKATVNDRIELTKLEWAVTDAWEAQAEFKATMDSAGQSVADHALTIADLAERYDVLSDEVGETIPGIDYLGKRMASLREIEEGLADENNEVAKSVEDLVLEFDALVASGADVSAMYDGVYGKQLKIMEAEKEHGDITHWVNLAMEDTSYISKLQGQNFKWLDGELLGHIKTVSNYADVQKKSTEEIKKNTDATRLNNLEMMKIQLKGMIRRRGLTRGEQRKIKRYEIENMRIRINTAQRTAEGIDEINSDNYQKSKDYIDKYVRDEEHSLWMLKDTRQEDIDNLKATILGKEQTMLGLTATMQEEYSIMSDSARVYNDIVYQYFGEQIPDSIQESIDMYRNLRIEAANTINEISGKNVIDVPTSPIQQTIYSLLKEKAPTITNMLDKYGFGVHQRGTHFAQYTGLHHLEKGEQVLPKGSNSSGSNITININNNVDNISNDMDVNKMARTQARIIAGELNNRYGMR